MSSNRIPVVVIIALPHSGSHLLSQLLGAHSRCLSIGELHNYDKHLNRARGDNVIASFQEDALFEGLADTPTDERHERIMRNAMALYPATSTLIDNSKRVAWCERLLGNPRLEIMPLHLVRDPRALVRYWLKSYDSPRRRRQQRIRHARLSPRQALSLLTCSELELYLRKWLIRNKAATRLLAKTGHGANVVTYHDVASRTAETLERLMPALGLDYEATQLRYGDATQHGTLKRDYQQLSERSEIRLDVRWQEDLTEAQIDAISNDDRIARYLERLGLTMTAQGLTAVTADSGNRAG